MRHYNLIFLLIIPLFSISQSLPRHVIASGGEHFTNNQISIAVTVGQAGFVGSFYEETIELNIGFQQMESSTSTGISDISQSDQVLVFPNPFTDQFSIEFKGNTFWRGEYHLYNALGEKIIHFGPFSILQNDNIKNIQAASLLPGIYHLTIYLYSKENQMAIYSTSLISI